MPEHDAFGREIGDDPLASLRGASEPQARPAPPPPRPVPPPAPERAVTVTAPVFVRRRRRGFVALLLLLGLVVAGAALAVTALVGVGERLDGLVREPDAAVRAPAGLERASLIRQPNLERALATLREARLGRLATLRVAPDRIDAVLVVRGGRARSAQVTFDGVLRRFGVSAGGFGDTPGIGYGRIDASAPERLVRRGAKRTRRASTRNVDYLVLSPGPPLTWGAYFKGGAIVMGDARGRPTRVL